MLTAFTHLADWLTFDILGLPTSSKFADALHFFIEDTSKIFVLLAVMIFTMGFLRAGFAAEQIRARLAGRNRFVCYFLAAMVGAITPFCSCSSITLFLGFAAARIPVGITMSFLITSPMINEAAVVIFASSLGWPITLLYLALGISAGVIGGIFFDFLRAERLLTLSVLQSDADFARTARMSFTDRIRFAQHETAAILQKIWLWVIIGIALGAGLHGYVPDGFIAAHLGGGQWWNVPFAVAIGIPVYANVTSVIPVVSELIHQGLPIGTAFAFMLSTAAASVPEFIMLRRVCSLRMLVYFGGYLLLAFTVMGWLLNLFH
ncbi:MAG: permease [Kiritimatiellia bacterium]